MNHFTVSNGNIIGAHFDGFRYGAPTYILQFDYFMGSNEFASGGNESFNTSGFAGLAFTPASASAAVPEPASIALLGAGLAGISAFRRRRKPA